MALRKIRTIGDEILNKKSREVGEINDSIIALLDDMLETLRERDGVGLAAPQVGVLRRVAVVEYEDELFEMINPKIVDSEGEQTCSEACLSVPGKVGDIERPMSVVIEATDRNGDLYEIEADEFLASVFCHELDHLDGVLYLENATNIRNQENNKKTAAKR